MRNFLEDGGGVVVLGEHALFRNEKTYRLNQLVAVFGAKFVGQPTSQPLKPSSELRIEDLETYEGKTIELKDLSLWQILIRDVEVHIVMTRRSVGKGKLLVVSRVLSGRQPNAKDPINAAMWQSILADLMCGKQIDPTKPPTSGRDTWCSSDAGYTQEATHSWVLPFAEPMWNEGIATYVGILLGREFGLNKEANATLKRWIDGAKRHDPEMTKFDLASGTDIPHVVRMAKPMWIFEQLRTEEPRIISKYFQAKRRLIDPKKQKRYTANDSVAVLSTATGRNLFDWFRSLGIDVKASRTKVPHP